MHHIVSAIALCLVVPSVSAADLPPAATYQGELALPDGGKLPLEVEFFRNAAGAVSANMASPTEGARYVSVSSVSWADDQLSVHTVAPDALISGELRADGVWLASYQQGEFGAELQMHPSDGMTEIPRSQSQRALGDWRGQDLSIETTGAMLAATHVRPHSVKAAALLLAGSGATQRDGYHSGHRPLAVLAGALAEAGVATLRYDKRGVYRSSGSLDVTDLQTIVGDARAALLKLRALHPQLPVIVIGHSEGGVVAAMLRASDPQLAGVVSLMGPTMPTLDLFTLQDSAQARAAGANAEQAATLMAFARRIYIAASEHTDSEQRMAALGVVLEQASEAERALFERYNGGTGTLGVGMLSAAHYDELLAVKPMNFWQQSSIPALLLFGEHDVQVPAAQNAQLVQGVNGTEVMTVAGVNHVLQPATDGARAQYAEIEISVDPTLMAIVSQWIARLIDSGP